MTIKTASVTLSRTFSHSLSHKRTDGRVYTDQQLQTDAIIQQEKTGHMHFKVLPNIITAAQTPYRVYRFLF